MKKLLVSIAVVLFLVCTADAAQPKISPDRINTSQPFPSILMGEDANITLDGGWLINASSSTGAIPETYGAVGNGIADDTNALKWAIQNNSMTVLLPGSTYKVTSAIDPSDWQGKTVIARGASIVLGSDITLINVSDKNITWIGGAIKTDSTYTSPVMKFSAGHSYAHVADIRIYDENVDGVLDGDWEGIRITGEGHHSEFRNIQIYGAKIGLNGTAEGSSWITAARFTDLDFISCNQSFKLVGANGNEISNLGVIYHLQTPGYGIILDNSDFNTFVGYENWWDGSLLSTFEAVQTTATANGNRFIGGHFEGSIHDHGGIILDSVRSYIMRSGIDGTNAGIMSNTGTYNYLLNGNLETNANNWIASDVTATRNTDNYKIGQASLKLVGDGSGYHYAYQHVLPQNHNREFLTFGAWVFGNSTNTGNPYLTLQCSDAGKGYVSSGESVPSDSKWHFVSITLDVSAMTTEWITAYLWASDVASNTDVAYFDGIQMVDGPVCSMQYMPHYVGT